MVAVHYASESKRGRISNGLTNCYDYYRNTLAPRNSIMDNRCIHQWNRISEQIGSSFPFIQAVKKGATGFDVVPSVTARGERPKRRPSMTCGGKTADLGSNPSASTCVLQFVWDKSAKCLGKW